VSATRSAIVLGATSGIGREVARRLGSEGYDLVLAGRDEAELQRHAADVAIRYGVRAEAVPFDAEATATHEAFYAGCRERLGGSPEVVVLCYGDMADQREAERDFGLARRMIDVNLASPISVLEIAARDLIERGRGTLCAIGSVAGDRGRQSNYLYGSTKAGLATYLQGLRHRLARTKVRVLTVKPGFVDTGMTWGLLKSNSPLVASPAKVAEDIVKAIHKKRRQLYTPWFWRWIMLIIRTVPEPLFVRTKL
jgi:short-subunit dehydrogenase